MPDRPRQFPAGWITACPARMLGSKKCEHKAAFPLSCPIKIAICPSPCSTMWKAVCLDDNVEMTDRSIQGGFSAVGLPRAINRRGGPKEGEKKGGSRWKWKRREGGGATMRKDKLGSVVLLAHTGLREAAEHKPWQDERVQQDSK